MRRNPAPWSVRAQPPGAAPSCAPEHRRLHAGWLRALPAASTLIGGAVVLLPVDARASFNQPLCGNPRTLAGALCESTLLWALSMFVGAPFVLAACTFVALLLSRPRGRRGLGALRRVTLGSMALGLWAFVLTVITRMAIAHVPHDLATRTASPGTLGLAIVVAIGLWAGGAWLIDRVLGRWD